MLCATGGGKGTEICGSVWIDAKGAAAVKNFFFTGGGEAGVLILMLVLDFAFDARVTTI